MSRYRLVFTRKAKKELDKLDNLTRQRIAKKLLHYLDQDNPLSFARQLVDARIGSYRFRVGHYRIVFDIEDSELVVLSVKHRKDVYRM